MSVVTIIPGQNEEVQDVHADKSLKLLAKLRTVRFHHGHHVPHWHVDQEVLVVVRHFYNLAFILQIPALTQTFTH